jgi:ABC-2 type transport system permease protein
MSIHLKVYIFMHYPRWHRIWAIFVYHVHSILKDPYRLTVIFYWSFITIVLWGYSGIWAQAQSDHAVATKHLAVTLLIAVVLWQLLVRTSYNVALSLYQEVAAHNVMNLFATPLTLVEWTLAVILLATFFLIILICFLALMVWGLYAQSLFMIGWALMPALIALGIAGMSIGFFASACIITGGARLEDLVFMLSWGLAFFSGVFYSVEILPAWARAVAYCLPMVYVFDAIRAVIASGEVPVHLLITSIGLSCCYCVGTIGLFFYAFERSRSKGLARLGQ